MHELIWLAEDILFIKLQGTPTADSTKQLVKAIYDALHYSHNRFYILIDLRDGYITDIKAFSRIRYITQHKNWGGSVGFYKNPITDITNTVFEGVQRDIKDQDAVFKFPEQALAFLESLEVGITRDINWNKAEICVPA